MWNQVRYERLGQLFTKLIHAGKFDQAKDLIKGLSSKDLYDLIVEVDFDSETLLTYSFLMSLLRYNENADLHYYAANYLTFFLSYVAGAYSLALYHLRQAIELDPSNIMYQEFLLHFSEIPDHLVSKDEAIRVARKILEKKRESKIALRILSDCGIKHK